MIEKGNLSEALRYINRIRKRSHLFLLGKDTEAGAEFIDSQTTYLDDIDLDDSNGDQVVTLDNLMEHLRFVEKPLELALEADRHIDLRRWGVWKERLQFLAQFEYDAFHYRQNLTGKHPVRWRSYIMPAGEFPDFQLRVPGDPENSGNGFKLEVTLRDNFLGSQNFNDELHSYFPVPQDEINANLNAN